MTDGIVIPGPNLREPFNLRLCGRYAQGYNHRTGAANVACTYQGFIMGNP